MLRDVVLSGLGSNYGLQPYQAMIAHGPGWEHMIDLKDVSDFGNLAVPRNFVLSNFDREARRLTYPSKRRF